MVQIVGAMNRRTSGLVRKKACYPSIRHQKRRGMATAGRGQNRRIGRIISDQANMPEEPRMTDTNVDSITLKIVLS
jgi:hypothetical protein